MTTIGNACRVAGAYQALLFGYCGYRYIISSYNYPLFVEYLLSERPIEHKIIAGTIASIDHAVLAAMGFAVLDGTIDIVKGTHHFFGIRLLQRFTKSDKRRINLEKEINEMLEIEEK